MKALTAWAETLAERGHVTPAEVHLLPLAHSSTVPGSVFGGQQPCPRGMTLINLAHVSHLGVLKLIPHRFQGKTPMLENALQVEGY
jgi:hypothetical protein